MGVIVDSAPLAQAVTDFFTSATQPQSAFAVELGHDGHVIWRTEKDGKPDTFHLAPGANPKRRAQIVLYRLLPIEQLL
jgi:putative cardiolipin synthase